MKKKYLIALILALLFSATVFAEVEKSAIEIIQVNPYFYQGNLQIDITASNKGTIDGNIEMHFIYLDQEKTEKYIIPANEVRKFTYTVQNPIEGTLEAYIISDENRSCLIDIDPANELLDVQCLKDDLRKTKQFKEPDVMEKYFGKNWPMLFIGLIIFFVVAIIAYKFFSREKTQIEKDIESGRKLLKELTSLERWRQEKKKQAKTNQTKKPEKKKPSKN